jgi:hypothetical protein
LFHLLDEGGDSTLLLEDSGAEFLYALLSLFAHVDLCLLNELSDFLQLGSEALDL